ncbi:hypothetical protein RHMOL_Rhmol05G0033300 [Rhododendron molle]|uniref:Uncharacterized protein n=1 Tax=Rhododendron molle TaxID=49168 RepID=A0ACC0NLA7_RHOML|nr:hypothetical protein RHMOL_Rhmol05G0033300 [Rhododendron molle]
MVEPEIVFPDIQDDMNCAEAYVRFLCQWLLDNCLDMEFMVKKSAIDRPRMASSTKFVRISYTEAVAILEEALKERHEGTLHCCYFGALPLGMAMGTVLKESGKSGSTTAVAERKGSAEKSSKYHSHARKIFALQNA